MAWYEPNVSAVRDTEIMSSADWTGLIAAVIALLGALTAWLNSRTAASHASDAHESANGAAASAAKANGHSPPDPPA